MPETPTITEAVAALKQYVETLRQRPDIILKEDHIGPPADPALIQHFRDNPRLLPPALVDFYEQMNGADIAWHFPPQPGDKHDDYTEGGFHVYPLTYDTQLQTDDENGYSFFGTNALSLFVDEQQPEYGTWMAVYGPDGPMPEDERQDYHPSDVEYDEEEDFEEVARATVNVDQPQLVYQVYKNDYLFLPGTLAEYLLQAIAHGFVLSWPKAWQGQNSEEWWAHGVAELQAKVRRIQAPPAGQAPSA